MVNSYTPPTIIYTLRTQKKTNYSRNKNLFTFFYLKIDIIKKLSLIINKKKS